MTQLEVLLAADFAQRLSVAKQHEEHHKTDYSARAKRYFTGTLGELALEKHLGIEIVNWTIGPSARYHKPDLFGHDIHCGVKTVEYGKHPVIPKRPREHQVIMERWSDDTILLCGLATVEHQRLNQNDGLIVDPKLLARGTKTAMVGMGMLQQFEDLSHLRELIENAERHSSK